MEAAAAVPAAAAAAAAGPGGGAPAVVIDNGAYSMKLGHAGQSAPARVMAATVYNLGQAPLPAGVDVTLYQGMAPSGMAIGTLSTTTLLLPAQSERLEFDLASAPDVESGAEPAHAVVAPPSGVTECRPDNNASAVAVMECGPK